MVYIGYYMKKGNQLWELINKINLGNKFQMYLQKNTIPILNLMEFNLKIAQKANEAVKQYEKLKLKMKEMDFTD